MQALNRLASILDTVAEYGPITPTEIAQRMDLPFSTVARLVRQLAAEGFIARTAETNRYVIGWRIFDLAATGGSEADLATTALPLLTRLRNATHETVSLHVPRGMQRVCVASVESERELRRVVTPGSVQALFGTSGGEVILAGKPDSEVLDLADSLGLPKKDRPQLLERLEAIRRTGYVVAHNDELGVNALSAAVVRRGKTVAALTVSGPLLWFTPELAEQYAPLALEVAGEIAKLVSGNPAARA